MENNTLKLLSNIFKPFPDLGNRETYDSITKHHKSYLNMIDTNRDYEIKRAKD